MNRRGMLHTALIVCSLAGVIFIAGCATTHGDGMVSKDPVADRQRMMRLNGASWNISRLVSL